MSRWKMEELPELISDYLSKHADKLIGKIERSQQFLSDKLDDFNDEIFKLKAEIGKLKVENEQLKKSLAILSTEAATVSDAVHKQEVDLDLHQRAQLSANAILLGIPRIPNENTETLFDATCRTLGIETNSNSIVSCTRVTVSKGENHPIRVCFKNVHDKETLIARKKKFGSLTVSMIAGVRWPRGWSNKVHIRDDLSPLSMEILRDLKKKQVSLNLQYVWPGRNGIILAKQSKNSKLIKVQSRADLNRLISCRK